MACSPSMGRRRYARIAAPDKYAAADSLPMENTEQRAAREAGIAALKANDPQEARRHFEEIVAAGKADAATWVGLAMACYALKDGEAAIKAVDQALAVDPQNLHALILKGDDLARSGNTRAATGF